MEKKILTVDYHFNAFLPLSSAAKVSTIIVNDTIIYIYTHN
jgi:hypothetical protein